ncbi:MULTISPECIES: shikimate kinase [Staphylococcus]|uniref:Shikimate kinase n=1 Tax=Staphylococcus shinii TaxID=2912228 RepID=A0A418IGZ8_9STAP|nr:shikimate kinase [Staphylococcus shinii]MDW8565097.1 shikimate kinase [Staphylococcus shinii]MDW8568340.1 shikimate kinase [Staphylococcus shinii]MEC5300026.1 shikimate kinase [Staphylococcus shinii]PTI62741.1 shikimate kinase [Staphylococcus shinii]RIN01680.1 shikimate kinase [Staphylococcus shinii]
MEPLILIGFMGTGKTTLGKYLSKHNQLSYIDLDAYIVQQENQSIPDIFKQIGEAGFRELEYKYLKECINHYNIISTGGGIIEGDQTFDFLKLQRRVIWLDCDLNIVYNRIKNDSNRPNANNKSLFELKSLYSSRVSRYNEIAFIKLNSSKSLHSLQCEIMEEVVCE